MFMANIYTINKKAVHSSSSRFNSDQICMLMYLWAVIGPIEDSHAAFLFQEHSNINVHSNHRSFVLWICILLGSSKTGQNHGNQGRAVWALLSEPQQAAGTSAPFWDLWGTSWNINLQKMEDAAFCTLELRACSLLPLKWKTVEGKREGNWHGLLSLHYRHHTIQSWFFLNLNSWSQPLVMV